MLCILGSRILDLSVVCCVTFALDCHQLPQHCVLAQIRRTQTLNDLNVEHIMSLHGHLNKCFDDQRHLRFVCVYC